MEQVRRFMMWFLSIVFLLGLSIGSFINAWSFRYKTSRSIFAPSSCFSCGKKLTWIELVPILSFVFLHGKCRSCRARISFQYPLVELITGLVFVFIAYRFGFATTNYLLLTTHFVFWSLLIAISVYDIRQTIIPNGGAYFLAALGFISPIIFGNPEMIFQLEHIIAGPLLALPLACFWFFSRGKWMGLGDAKLELGIARSLARSFRNAERILAWRARRCRSYCGEPHCTALLIFNEERVTIRTVPRIWRICRVVF